MCKRLYLVFRIIIIIVVAFAFRFAYNSYRILCDRLANVRATNEKWVEKKHKQVHIIYNGTNLFYYFIRRFVGFDTVPVRGSLEFSVQYLLHATRANNKRFLHGTGSDDFRERLTRYVRRRFSQTVARNVKDIKFIPLLKYTYYPLFI